MVARFILNMTTCIFMLRISGAHGWNPSNFPFLPAGTDTSNIRTMVVEAQGHDKRILDFGCGQGYSTSDSKGCLGLDANLQNIKQARKLFPEKKFKLGILSSIEPECRFDVVTSMFYFHKIPQFIRKRIITKALEIADQRVVIVDVCPDYKSGGEMYKQSKFLEDYYENCRNDLSGFNETTLADGMISVWVHDV